MTRQEYFEVLNGQYIETAGTTARNQCVDLANSYIKYVLRLPIIEWTNAVDFPSKVGDEYKWIPNAATNVPKEGDLVIWGGNQYGHIAIFIEGDANTFRSFDENYPTGSPCHVQEHNYDYVDGWLRAIITQPTPQPDPTTAYFPQDSIKAIYKGILGIDPSMDELSARMKQVLIDKVPLWDVVSQVLQDDGRSPLKKIQSQLDNALTMNKQQADTIAELRKELVSMPAPDASILAVKAIVWGRGFWWNKINNLKKLLPK